MRMNVTAGGAPALAVFLRDLIDAEAFLLFGVEVFADSELRLARGLQINLPHRIVGARSGDMERATFAVIGAVEFGIVLRAFEVRQHVGIGPAGIAERSPVIVVAFVAANVDHGVDRGRAAERLAARLIADPPVEARLRHRVEGPVVDLAADHQDHRARGIYDPIVAGAAGLEQGDRGLGIFGKPARHRTAAGAAADHDKINALHRAHPPKTFLYRPAFWPGVGLDGLGLRLCFCATSGKSGLTSRFGGENVRFDRHKILKTRLLPLSKAVLRWYIRLATQRPFGSGCLLRKPPDGIDRRARALAKAVSHFGFSRGRATVYRGVEQPGSSSGS